jgi:protein-disulfide isomerase
MALQRRWILGFAAAAPALLRLAEAGAAEQPSGGPSMARLTSPRTIGNPNAPWKVTEFFSLTCTHCAAFQRETFPKVKTDLIDPGKLLLIYHDFPLDRVALLAAMVARALPPDRYEAFITTLFATQDRWAFARNVDPVAELEKLALLAGMPDSVFKATVQNQQLANFIGAEEKEAQDKYGVDSTPTFLCNGKTHAGEMTYDAFLAFVQSAAK